MLLAKVKIVISVLVLSLTLVLMAEGDDISLQKINGTLSTSPFLKKTMEMSERRDMECRNRPWICRRRREFPRRWRCCGNRCVDVSSDVNNCGFCGDRCPFGWQCCRGGCVNTNFSLFNCGRCGHRCPFGLPCLYGMCGYAQP